MLGNVRQSDESVIHPKHLGGIKMKILYETTMTNVGGRNGRTSSTDQSFVLDVMQPKELTGKEAVGTNPEQLFAAAYGSCFHGALTLIMTKARVPFTSSSVATTVYLLEDPTDKGWKIGVKMAVTIKGVTKDVAQKYTEMAHKACPYSKATRGNVDVELVIVE
jgi:osmotically inducible protein OsmC